MLPNHPSLDEPHSRSAADRLSSRRRSDAKGADMTTHVFQFPCLNDNYGALIHDSGSGRTAAIDAPDGDAVIAAAKAQGWRLSDVLVTHHHADHVQGLPAVRAAFPGIRVVGPAKEAA